MCDCSFGVRQYTFIVRETRTQIIVALSLLLAPNSVEVSLLRLNLSVAAAVMKSAPSEIHLLHFCVAISFALSLRVRQPVYVLPFCRPLERSKNPINIM